MKPRDPRNFNDPGVEYDGWPNSLVELARVIGNDAALRIVAFYGGISVYVPKKTDAEHPLMQIIGHDAFIALVKHHGGMELRDIPLMSALKNKRRAIVAFYHSHPGVTTRAIARELRTTERYVRQVLNTRPVLGQRRLFAD